MGIGVCQRSFLWQNYRLIFTLLKKTDIPTLDFPEGSPFSQRRRTIRERVELVGSDVLDLQKKVKLELAPLEDAALSEIRIQNRAVRWESLLVNGKRCAEANGIACVEHIGLLRWLYPDISIQIGGSNDVPVFEGGMCASLLFDSCQNAGSKTINQPQQVLRLKEEIKIGKSTRFISAKPRKGDDINLKVVSKFSGAKSCFDRRGESCLRAKVSPEFIYAISESRSNHAWWNQVAIDFIKNNPKLRFLFYPLMKNIYGRTADLRDIAFSPENIFVPGFSQERKKFIRNGVNFEVPFHAAADFLGLAGFLPGRPVGADILRFCGGHTFDKEFWNEFLKNSQLEYL